MRATERPGSKASSAPASREPDGGLLRLRVPRPQIHGQRIILQQGGANAARLREVPTRQ